MRPPLPREDLDFVLSLTQDFWSRFAGARMFITGGTGFIGGWLLEVIQRANQVMGCGMEAIVLSRDPDRARGHAPHLFSVPEFRLIAGDVTTFQSPVGKFDLCIHGATDVADRAKASEQLQIFDSCVQGTRRVLDFAAASGAGHFLLTSSGAVYGPQPAEISRVPETFEGAPSTLEVGTAYGQGKRAAEWLACACSAHAEFHVAIARIFALLGPGLPLSGPFAAGNFVRDVIDQRPIEIKGDGRPLRSYLYMADACIWLLRIIASGVSGRAYNLGSEEEVPISALAERIVTAASTNLPVHVRLTANPAIPAPRYVPDTMRARKELGLEQYTPLETALRKTIEWSRMAASL